MTGFNVNAVKKYGAKVDMSQAWVKYEAAGKLSVSARAPKRLNFGADGVLSQATVTLSSQQGNIEYKVVLSSTRQVGPPQVYRAVIYKERDSAGVWGEEKVACGNSSNVGYSWQDNKDTFLLQANGVCFPGNDKSMYVRDVELIYVANSIDEVRDKVLIKTTLHR